MDRSGRKREGLWIVCVVWTLIFASCKPDSSPTSWPIQVNYIEGTPVDLAWLVLLRESEHSGNWQDGYTLEAVSDTFHTDKLGHGCIPIRGLEGTHHLHIGTHDEQTGKEILLYQDSWDFPIHDAASITLPTPFWIRCVGGRNEMDVAGIERILVWNGYDPGPSLPTSLLSFTPGSSPIPSLLLTSYVHPYEVLPAVRQWHAAAITHSGQLDTLPSFSLSIEQKNLIDTIIVEQFW
jgi:hypothetical protein